MHPVHCFVMEKYCLACATVEDVDREERKMQMELEPKQLPCPYKVACGATAAWNIMHNGFWSIDIYGIGLPQSYRR